MRKLWMTTALMAFAFAGAQNITPTTGSGTDQLNITNGLSATATQTVTLKLPQATGLHLDVTNLTFDIGNIAQENCYYGTGSDVNTQLGSDFWNQTQTQPLGTYYAKVDSAPQFGTVTIKKADGTAATRATSYPPGQLGANGELVAGSKGYFVCYKTFILQKFSNVGNFKLSVSRDNPTTAAGKQMLYIQDNPCDRWGEGTGLYRLNPGGSLELLPVSMTTGTTGARAAASATGTGGNRYCRANSSWLDDLIVIAVVVDGDPAGNNTATLTYTLTSSATPFTATAAAASSSDKPK